MSRPFDYRVPAIGLALAAGLLIARAAILRRPPPLSDLGALPAFTLTDQAAARYGSADLAGKVWVGSFIFTRCRTICPLVIERMKRVDAWAAAHPDAPLRLVSISVDPEGDTPDRLAVFARERGIDASRWRLLTGDAAALEDVVVRGFHLAMGQPRTERTEAGERMDILHSPRLVLVDARGRIRGYYDDDLGGIDRLLADIPRLIAETPHAR